MKQIYKLINICTMSCWLVTQHLFSSETINVLTQNDIDYTTTNTMQKNHVRSFLDVDMESYFNTILTNKNGNYHERNTLSGNLYNPPAIEISVMHETINTALNLYKRRLDNGSWVNNEKPLPELNNAHIQQKIFEVGSEIIFFGDLHGSIHALIRSMKELQKTGYLDSNYNLKQNCYMFFLGDLVDYGDYGIDTLFTVFQLVLRNPDSVFVCRGNHEEEVQFNQPRKRDSLFVEINERYQQASRVERLRLKDCIQELFFKLPHALFIGINSELSVGYAQCCHGGFEDEAHTTLLNLFLGKNEYAKLDNSLVEKHNYLNFNHIYCNFNWGDVSGLNTLELDSLAPHNGGRYARSQGRVTPHTKKHSINEAIDIMRKTNIAVLFRGHADACNSFKATFSNINYPVFPLLEEKTSWAKHYYAAYEFDILNYFKPKIDLIIGDINSLYTTGFSISDFKEISPAPIFTFSNALTSKVFHDYGFGIVRLNYNWDESIIRAYVKKSSFAHTMH